MELENGGIRRKLVGDIKIRMTTFDPLINVRYRRLTAAILILFVGHVGVTKYCDYNVVLRHQKDQLERPKLAGSHMIGSPENPLAGRAVNAGSLRIVDPVKNLLECLPDRVVAKPPGRRIAVWVVSQCGRPAVPEITKIVVFVERLIEKAG